ncbi:unnamed protein product, partial [Didymodactylos carnosus]
MNVFHWHIVDDQSFPYDSRIYPEMSKKGAYDETHTYSQGDIADILEFARQRGIRVMAEFDSPERRLTAAIETYMHIKLIVKADTIVEVWKDPYPEEMARVTKLGYRTLLSTCWYLNLISYGSDWRVQLKMTQEELDATNLQINKVTNESLEATRRMLNHTSETQEIGVKTLTKLAEQEEQLDNIHLGLKRLSGEMTKAEDNMSQLEKCCGL